MLFQEKKITSSGKTTELPVLLDGGAHPVDLGVAGDGGVVDVDHDHLVVPGQDMSYRCLISWKGGLLSLVGRILANPVRVKNPESLESTSNLEETIVKFQ